MVSGQLVDIRLKLRKRPKYYLTFGLIFFLLSTVFGLGVTGHFGKFGAPLAFSSDYTLLALLCLVCGIQNGTITTVSKSVIRTTHLTGVTTDLGTGIGFRRLCLHKARLLGLCVTRFHIRYFVFRNALFSSFSVQGKRNHSVSNRRGTRMNYMTSEEFYYSQTGEWVQVDETLVTVGLTDFRLYQLGEVLFLDLPEDGKLVRQGEAFFSIESVKMIHDFISPVSGTIIEVNQQLFENPAILNDDPFNEGWIIKIEMENEKDLSTLMRSTEYRQQVILKSSSLQGLQFFGQALRSGPENG